MGEIWNLWGLLWCHEGTLRSLHGKGVFFWFYLEHIQCHFKFVSTEFANRYSSFLGFRFLVHPQIRIHFTRMNAELCRMCTHLKRNEHSPNYVRQLLHKFWPSNFKLITGIAQECGPFWAGMDSRLWWNLLWTEMNTCLLFMFKELGQEPIWGGGYLEGEDDGVNVTYLFS